MVLSYSTGVLEWQKRIDVNGDKNHKNDDDDDDDDDDDHDDEQSNTPQEWFWSDLLAKTKKGRGLISVEISVKLEENNESDILC